MEREIRRHQNTLLIVGVGVIAIGVWNVIKMNLHFVMEPDALKTILPIGVRNGDAHLSDRWIETIYIVSINLLGMIDILIRLFIAATAKKIAFDQKVSRPGFALFIALICLGLIAEVCSVYSQVTGNLLTPSFVTSVATILMSILSMILFLQMLRSTFTIRKLYRSLPSRQKAAPHSPAETLGSGEVG